MNARGLSAVAIALTIGALPATLVLGDEMGPAFAKGFEPNAVYQLGELDHVNLFNGNLLVTLPLGPRYPVGGGFSYGLSLVYNSKIWEYTWGCPGPDGEPVDSRVVDPATVPEGCLQGIVDPKANAGAGWRLSFGDLYGPGAQGLFELQGKFLFVGPDGAEHELEPTVGGMPAEQVDLHHSRDGSYLRLLREPAGAPAGSFEVQSGDGTGYLFVPDAGDLSGWRLVEIHDPFGNWVRFVHLSSTVTVVSDETGRSHRIVTDAAGKVTRVELAGPGGVPSVFTFEYGSDSIIPGCPHDHPRVPGIPGSGTEVVPELLRVVLPDRVTAFEMGYVPGDSETSQVCTLQGGRLARLRLPTLGALEYTYGGYILPRPKCYEKPVAGTPPDPGLFTVASGVRSRTMRAADGETVLGEWRYLAAGPLGFGGETVKLPSECKIPDVTYTDVYEPVDNPVAGTRFRLTRNFFDIHFPGEFGGTPENCHGVGFGLGGDCFSPDPAATDRLRSSMVFACSRMPLPEEYQVPDGWPDDRRHLWIPASCTGAFGATFSSPEQVHGIRESYVHYEDDGPVDSANPRAGVLNARVASDAVYFNEDQGRSIVTVRSDFDRFGHYRRTDVSSDFGPSSGQDPNRIVFVDYNARLHETLPGRNTPWILDIYPERRVTEGGVTNSELFDFDPSTGALRNKRTLRSLGSPGATSDADLRVDFEYDADGNPDVERYSGGDPQGAFSGSPVQYEIHSRYDRGALVERQYCRPGSAPDGGPCADADVLLRTLDAEVDPATGLPVTIWDGAGVRTDLAYDSSWRLTERTPQAVPGQLAAALTRYIYQPATRQAPPKVKVERYAGSARLTRRTLIYDGFGRLYEDHTDRPGGGESVRRMDYTPLGWPRYVSVLFDPADPGSPKGTVTSFDVFGRPTAVRHADGSRTTYVYNGQRYTLRSVRDLATPSGLESHSTIMLRNGFGQLVAVRNRDANGSVVLRTDYFYDPGGRLERVRQGSQNRTFVYDGAGLLLSESHPELGSDLLHRDYDARGHARVQRYSGPATPFDLDFTFDDSERLTEVRQRSTNRLLKELTYENLYASGDDFWKGDPRRGNTLLFQAKRHNWLDEGDVVVTETYAYGGRGAALSQRTVRTGGDGEVPRVRFSTTYTYDPLGTVASIGYPTCLQSGCGAYDPASGQVSDDAPDRDVFFSYQQGVLDGIGAVAGGVGYGSLTYHPDLTVASVAHGNGLTDRFVADADGLPRPARIEVLDGATTLWTSGSYVYDGAGNVREMGDDVFRYDASFDRLASATVSPPDRPGQSLATQQRSYGYDVYGNLLAIAGSGGRSFTVDAATNRLSGAGIAYDVAGDLTSRAGWSFAYDPFQQMTRAENDARGIVRRHLYTADDERLATIFGDGERELWSVRAPDNRVLRDFELLSNGWAWVEDYLHRNGQLLATIVRDGTPSGSVHHQHLDHLGTPRLITGPSREVLAEHKYLPYGEELAPLQDGERLRFTGHERDDLDPGPAQEGDLDYMHARYYSPWIGRFASVDAAAGRASAAGSWNRYVYASGRPTGRVDPDGLQDRDSVMVSYYEYNSGDDHVIVSFSVAKEMTPLAKDTFITPSGRSYELSGFSDEVTVSAGALSRGIAVANPASDPISLVISLGTGSAMGALKGAGQAAGRGAGEELVLGVKNVGKSGARPFVRVPGGTEPFLSRGAFSMLQVDQVAMRAQAAQAAASSAQLSQALNVGTAVGQQVLPELLPDSGCGVNRSCEPEPLPE